MLAYLKFKFLTNRQSFKLLKPSFLKIFIVSYTFRTIEQSYGIISQYYKILHQHYNSIDLLENLYLGSQGYHC